MADFAFFEIVQNESAAIVRYQRISGPRDRSNNLNAYAYLDADLLEKACADSETKKDGKVTRSPLPGNEALKLVLSDADYKAIMLTNKSNYTFKYY